MDCKTLAEVGLTAAIALFAGLTWQATRTYAYIAGVTLFIQASKDISGVSQGVDIPMAKRTMKALRKRFPRVYEDMRECLNPNTRDEIEKA
jgi:hypothetical protein